MQKRPLKCGQVEGRWALNATSESVGLHKTELTKDVEGVMQPCTKCGHSQKKWIFNLLAVSPLDIALWIL